jgi:transcriptional regulator with XRE-family HTH domain
MGPQELGTLFRAVRRRRGLRQIDVARLAGVSDSTVSLVERGHLESLSFGKIKVLAAALDVRVDVTGSWRGGDGSRLVNRAHSLLAESFAEFVAQLAEWLFEPEVSVSFSGERAILDTLGFHRRTAHLAVMEFKTEIVDFNGVLGTLSRYVRLARRAAEERGWPVQMVSCWLIVTDTRTNRRHFAEHAALVRARFPADGRQFRAFLLHPDSPTFGVLFWPDSRARGVGQGATAGKARVRVVKAAGAPRPRSAPEAERRLSSGLDEP